LRRRLAPAPRFPMRWRLNARNLVIDRMTEEDRSAGLVRQ
jgi:hypothetical protein